MARSRTEGAVRQVESQGASRKTRRRGWSTFRGRVLDRDECAQRGQVPHQQSQLQPPSLQQGQPQPVPLQAGPLQSGPFQQVPPDQARDIAAELVGWNPGELPGQLPEQYASWPPGGPLAADQPPASA